ncbi:dTDP-4-dehydrorhamnose 3,5-epimerase [[Clostridium] fimetarium]|uniref:dTDP-4-dehydrorhamnose 3,5-epimerase n=1 Tax=[Clostridium] fimetarium TaxID=99656 RepID=A0A1I0QSU8_9FIRM|nr:dTDP-4-dehydrorhamnose 3,5-epimerase [[Clostridium] fimetarium]SEW30634.1 dTDP-4-dehydrorhamnose 3,5-epimerase [[Clostridium] fimetarium]
MIKVTPLEIKEVLVLEYEEYEDSRGLSVSTFSKKELEKVGIVTEFLEENIYCPQKAGTLYGIHFQNKPVEQTKLLYCMKGRGLDFAIDLRRDSNTYKKWVCVELSSDNRKQIYIPKGFGHAFLSLEDNTTVVMKIDNYFHPDYRKGIVWNDPELNVEFPIENPILAQHDVDAPFLKDSGCNL